MNLRVRLSLFMTAIVGTMLFGVCVFPESLPSGQATVAQAAVTVNAKNQGMVGDGETANNRPMQAMLDKWNQDDLTVRVPKGTYVFYSGKILLHSNITFKFDKGAVFRVTDGNEVYFVYPSPQSGYDGGLKNITWQGATFQGDKTNMGQSVFVQSVHHAQNINFQNCLFDNAESPTGHYLDLDGSHNIEVTGSIFTGFDGSRDYKEAIQVDYSNQRAMSYQNPGDQYDDLPTYGVTVTDNQFLPVQKVSGSVKVYAPNPIGEHAVYDDGAGGIIHDVRFSNNTVVDPKPLTSSAGSGMATIHFKGISNLWITGNRFINRHVLGSGDYIYLRNTLPAYQMKNINIENNTFTDVNPIKSYVHLDSRYATNPMTQVTITGNKATTQRNQAQFLMSNFPMGDNTVAKNSIKKTKKTSTVIKPQRPIKPTNVVHNTSQKLKKRKQTNKHEDYFKGLASQHAQLSKKHQGYTLYNHIKGHKNWNALKFKWKSIKTKRVYLDMRAQADTGKWYRIRFSKKTNAKKYWIRKGALTFDKFTSEAFDHEATLVKVYPVYTRPFNDPLLAQQRGTTGDITERVVQITRRVRRKTSSGSVTTFYQMSNGLWTRASAFELQ